MTMYKSYIITGLTASGKSDFAHAFAKRVNGTIINCDSVQIYRGIENISASPFAGRTISDEIDGVPYKLFSILSLDAHISVADYIKMARTEYDNAIDAGRVPIFVGGTGFYINGIINGVAEIPEISPDVRAAAREMVANNPNKAKKMVPTCVAHDPQRIARAVEVWLQTGRHLTDWWNDPKFGAIVPTPFKIVINPPVDILHERIAKRIPIMIDGGALQEVQYMLDNNFDLNRAIGAEQINELLQGKVSHNQTITNWITKTNQYAKRQRTWFKTQFNADLVIDHLPSNKDLDLIK